MHKGTTHVALDDSKRKLVIAILRADETKPEEREIANDPHHIRRLFDRLNREGAPVEACYEAGVNGYELHRQLTGLGVPCQVIAPALTPRRPGQRIKTDRRDAAKLVRLFRAGELTAIHVPDEAEEAVRDLLRCRDAVRRDVLRWRHRLLKFLTRHGRLYTWGRNWTQRHWRWIREQRFDLPPLQRTLEATQFAPGQALARLAELDKEIDAIAQEAPSREPVGWLRCFRGIDTLSAMILLAEIVDFQRFRSPPGADGRPGPGPQRVLLGREPAPRRAHQSRQLACPPRARGGRLALSASAHCGARPGPAECWPAPRRGHPRLARTTPPPPAVSPSGGARETAARRRGRDRPRTRGLPLGRADPQSGGCVIPGEQTKGVGKRDCHIPERRQLRPDAGTIGAPSRERCDARRDTRDDSRV